MTQPPASSTGYGGASLLDLEKYPTAQEFVARCHDFFREVKDLYVPTVPFPLSMVKIIKINIDIGIRDDLLITHSPTHIPSRLIHISVPHSLYTLPQTSHANIYTTRTPGSALETRLNSEYGPGNVFYEDFCRYMRQGLKEGWVAQDELDGPRYRRGRIAAPTAESSFISITTVYVSLPLPFLSIFLVLSFFISLADRSPS